VAFSSKARDLDPQFNPNGLLNNVFRASTAGAGDAETASVAPENGTGNDVLSDGNMVTGGGSVGHVLSPDGFEVAFFGISSNWGAAFSAEWQQVYVRDFRNPESKNTWKVSPFVSDDLSRYPSISSMTSNAIRAAYSTRDAINDPGGNGIEDVFTVDLDLDTGVKANLMKASFTPGGAHGNGDSILPALSRSGNFVAFASSATNLVTGDTNGNRDVFLRKLDWIETLTRSSVNSAGQQSMGNGAESTAPDVTDDGAAVVFESTQTQLVAGDTNGNRDVFRRYTPRQFIRGDANQDTLVDLADAIFIQNALFLGGEQPACKDAADAQDDGLFNISDAVYILNFKYMGGPQPPSPFPDCGIDPTLDTLTCLSGEGCPGQ
jgi:hypothetical protein